MDIDTIIKKLEKKYMMPFRSMIINLTEMAESEDYELANNERCSIQMVLDLILTLKEE